MSSRFIVGVCGVSYALAASIGCASSAPAPEAPAGSTSPIVRVPAPTSSALAPDRDAALDAKRTDAGPARDAGIARDAAPPAAPPRVGDVDFSAREQTPAGYVCDGDLKEWGQLVADSAGAPSHASLSLSSKGLAVAVDLAEARGNGVWLEAKLDSIELPPVGYYQRGGGVRQLACDFKPNTETPLPATERANCVAILARHDALSKRYEAGFRRLYRIDAGGVRVLGDKSSLRPIAGATASFAVRAGRSQLEVNLPPLALPRAATAPVTRVQIALFDQAESAVPATTDKDRAELELPKPVDFEPMGAVRALVFQNLMVASWAGPRMSYQPGEGLPLEVIAYNGTSLMTLSSNRRVLFTPGPKLGRVELGYGFDELRGMIVFVDGAPKEIVSASRTRQVVERAGALHVVSGSEGFDEASARPTADWRVTIVGPDGGVTHVDLPQPQVPFAWESAGIFHNGDWSQFGMRGRAFGGASDKAAALEILWAWKATTRAYELIKPAPGKP